MNKLSEVKPHSFIFEQKQALPDFLCDDMVSRFEANQADQYAGRVGSDQGSNTSLKKTTDIDITPWPLTAF